MQDADHILSVCGGVQIKIFYPVTILIYDLLLYISLSHCLSVCQPAYLPACLSKQEWLKLLRPPPSISMYLSRMSCRRGFHKCLQDLHSLSYPFSFEGCYPYQMYYTVSYGKRCLLRRTSSVHVWKSRTHVTIYFYCYFVAVAVTTYIQVHIFHEPFKMLLVL